MQDVSQEALQAHRDQVQELDAKIADHVQTSAATLQELIDQRNEVQRAAFRMDRELNPHDTPPE